MTTQEARAELIRLYPDRTSCVTEENWYNARGEKEMALDYVVSLFHKNITHLEQERGPSLQEALDKVIASMVEHDDNFPS